MLRLAELSLPWMRLVCVDGFVYISSCHGNIVLKTQLKFSQYIRFFWRVIAGSGGESAAYSSTLQLLEKTVLQWNACMYTETEAPCASVPDLLQFVYLVSESVWQTMEPMCRSQARLSVRNPSILLRTEPT